MRRLQSWMLALACLACCIPLVLAVAGVSGGVAGTVGVWIGRYDVVIIGAAVVAVTLTMVVRRLQERRKAHCSDPGLIEIKPRHYPDNVGS